MWDDYDLVDEAQAPKRWSKGFLPDLWSRATSQATVQSGFQDIRFAV